MNKTELVKAIAEKSKSTVKQADLMFEAAMETIVSELQRGSKVTIPGFGTFTANKRAARMGVNPQTMEKIKIKATTIPSFKAGKNFRESLTSPSKSKKASPKTVAKPKAGK